MLVCDAATRRIAIDPVLMAQRTKKMMQEMRGPKELAETSQEYLGRLKKGKAAAGVAVAEPTVVADMASRKFEAPADFTAPTSSTPTAKPSMPPAAKPKEAEGDDFAARLMKAKKKAREEMDEHKEG